MQVRAGNNTDEEPYRFFTQKEIDSILREGSKHGRAGSHAAIATIMAHEPNLERAELWKRIRQLKRPPHKPARSRILWNAEDDQLLRTGYGLGGTQKHEAIRQILRRHPDWEPSAIWKRAKKLGLVQARPEGEAERLRRRWSRGEDLKLIGMAGEMKLGMIAQRIGRSERAIACRLAWLGKRRRVHNEGYARKSLAQDLHMGWTTVQKLIIDGFLEVRDPRITKASIARLKQAGLPSNGVVSKPAHAAGAPVATFSGAAQNGCRAKRIWAAVAAKLNVTPDAVEKLIVEGALKLCDPRVTESSLQEFCHRYGAALNHGFLTQDTRAWLQTCMDLDPNAGQEVARRFAAPREHALIVRTCERCGRSIRGNVFFRHFKDCQGQESAERTQVSEVRFGS